jgi:hypothetical protein
MAASKQKGPTGATGSVAPGAYAQGNPLPTGGSSAGGGDTGVSVGYIPPPREGVTGSGKSSEIVTATGEKIPFYNLGTNPGELLAGFNEVSLKKFVNTAYSRGWYGNDKPGGGLSESDKRAMANIMYYSNLKGMAWHETLSLMAKAPTSDGTSSGSRLQTTSMEDLVELAQRSALSTIGRKLTPDEAAKFAQAYQGTQRTQAMGGGNASSTDVYFQNRIEKQYGAESDGYKYLSAIGNVAKLMESI